MILNVSGRTDIVAFYAKWFMKRYKEGFVDVRNPFYPKMVNRIYFEDVDLILFCTKNPIPILKYIKEIDKKIIFHITLTPYKNDIEINVPNKNLIIKSIKKLSSIVGIDNLYIRYDPIFISDKYTINYHIKAFDKLCKILNGYVKHFIISFLDEYKNVKKNMKYIKSKQMSDEDYKQIGINFSKSAIENGMTVQTCFEDINLVEYGFRKDDCLSHEYVYKLTGKTNFKNYNIRKGNKCKCVSMVDIGAYNTCMHFCKYCYANYDEKAVIKNFNKHYIDSTLLLDYLKEDDIIKRRS